MKKSLLFLALFFYYLSFSQINLTIDQSFGTNGIVQIGLTSDYVTLDKYNNSTFQGNKIFAAYKNNTPGSSTKFYRLNADGSLDTTFGTNGEVIVPEWSSPYYYSNNDFFYLNSGKKYFSNGQLDQNFGNNGIPAASYWNYIFVDNNGKIVARNNSDFTRYNADGTLDTSFGTNGVLSLDTSLSSNSTFDVKLFYLANNYVYEIAGNHSKVRKINLNNGTLDTAFGQNGVAHNIGGGNIFSNVSILSNINSGKYFNLFDDGTDVRLTKMNSSGNTDNNFGSGGYKIVTKMFTTNGVDFYVAERQPLMYGNSVLISAESQDAGKIGFSAYSLADGSVGNVNGQVFFPLQEVSFSNVESLYSFVKDNYLYVFYDNKIARYIFNQSSLALNTVSKNNREINFNNPFTDELNLITNEKIKSVEIYDEAGRKVLKSDTTKNIDTSNLQKGMYIIKITTQSNTIIPKKGIKN